MGCRRQKKVAQVAAASPSTKNCRHPPQQMSGLHRGHGEWSGVCRVGPVQTTIFAMGNVRQGGWKVVVVPAGINRGETVTANVGLSGQCGKQTCAT